jgi:hypothetical protein
MKRYAAITAFLALGVLACNQIIPPPAVITCTPAEVQPAASVTETTPIVSTASFKAVDANKIGAVEDNRLLMDSTGLATGDIIASNCNDGLLRKVSKITTTGLPGIRPQDFSKVYIETEAAPLEDIITSGEVTADYGELNFAQAQGIQLQSGVNVQAVTGELKIASKVFKTGPVTVTLDGKLVSALQPKFRIKFVGGKVDVFEVGLAGLLIVDLQGKIQATLAATQNNEAELAKFEFKRAFLLGAVPVVMVVTPRLLVGYNVGVSGDVSVTAKVTPTLNMGYGLKYVRAEPDPTKKWQKVPTPPSLTLNPTFNYAAQVQGTAGVYAKLVIGVKFYGIAGPELTAESKVTLNLTNTGAKLFFGSNAKGTLAAGFKVLGLDLNTSLPDVPMFNASQGFNCTLAGVCTEAP